MKAALNVLRVLLFVVLCPMLIGVVFWLYRLSGFYIIRLLGWLDVRFNGFVFWVLFFFVVLGLITVLWNVIQIVAAALTAILAKISPYRSLTMWFVCLISLCEAIIFIGNFWVENQGDLTTTCIVVGCVLSFMALSLFAFFWKVSNEISLQLKVEREVREQVDRETEEMMKERNLL